MNDSEDKMMRLIGMVYDAALNEQKWPTFLEAFSSAVGAGSSLLRSVDLNTNTSEFASSFGYDPAWKTAYCDHFVKMDYLTRSISQSPLGAVWSNDRAFPVSEQRKTEIYNDYLKPQGKTYCMGALLVKEGSYTLGFSAQRDNRAGAWGENERRLTQVLAPHVVRAVHVHRKINTAVVEKKYAHGTLDQLRIGVILTNRFGTPLYLNRAAELMMTQEVGLGVFYDRLAVYSASETVQLQKLIADAAPGIKGGAVGGDLRITMPNKVECLHCSIMPVSAELSTFLNIPLAPDCVALFLTKPGNLQLSPKRLVTLYKITPAEARIAARLAALRTVEEASDDLGITVQTARSQLKSVFVKMGVKSQSELIMLLATGTLGHINDE